MREMYYDSHERYKEFLVRFSDCDYTSRAHLSSLFRFMEETTVADFVGRDCSFQRILSAGYAVLLSRQKIRLTHYPVEGEMLKVDTWTKKISGKVAWRDFSIKDLSGSVVAQGTSSWILVSMKTGRAVDFSEFPFPECIAMRKEEALDEKLDLLPPGEGGRVLYARPARYTDLDMYRHVNHCKLVEWVMDSFDLAELRARPIVSLQMNYVSQVTFGEVTNIVRFDDSRHHTVLFGIDAKNPELVRFQARVGFSGT